MRKQCCAGNNWKFRDIISTAVLVLLNKNPTHGYELMQEVSVLIGSSPTLNGLIYRLLILLESEGMVASQWEIEKGSQPKRVYHITDSGRAYLSERMALMENQILSLSELVNIYKKSEKERYYENSIFNGRE